MSEIEKLKAELHQARMEWHEERKRAEEERAAHEKTKAVWRDRAEGYSRAAETERAGAAKLRAVLADVDNRGVEHPWDCELLLKRNEKCTCGAWDLDQRVSEALEATDAGKVTT